MQAQFWAALTLPLLRRQRRNVRLLAYAVGSSVLIHPLVQPRQSHPPAPHRDDDRGVPAQGLVGALCPRHREGAHAEAVVPHVNVRGAELEGGRAK